MDALASPRPSTDVIEAAERWRAPAGDLDGGGVKISGMLDVYILAQWGGWSDDPRVDKALHRRVIEKLAVYPLWAIEAGLCRVWETSIYRPKMAEILAAVRAAFGDLVTPLERAKARVEQVSALEPALPESRSSERKAWLDDLLAGLGDGAGSESDG